MARLIDPAGMSDTLSALYTAPSRPFGRLLFSQLFKDKHMFSGHGHTTPIFLFAALGSGLFILLGHPGTLSVFYLGSE